MAEEETKEELGGESNQQDSTSLPRDTSEYLKPWMKNLGKAYAQNEEIAEYDSLTDCVAGLLKRPRAKDVPDSYDGIPEDAGKLFRNAGLTAKEAKAIDGYYRKLIPEKVDLKEALGDSYESTMRSFEKGKGVLKDIARSADEMGRSEDPLYVRLMAIIGDNAASSPAFVTPRDSAEEESSAMKMLKKAYGVR